MSSVHWSDAPVTPDPVRRGSSRDGMRAFFCWRHAGRCMFDRCGEPRLGRCDGAGVLIPRLQELSLVHDVGALCSLTQGMARTTDDVPVPEC